MLVRMDINWAPTKCTEMTLLHTVGSCSRTTVYRQPKDQYFIQCHVMAVCTKILYDTYLTTKTMKIYFLCQRRCLHSSVLTGTQLGQWTGRYSCDCGASRKKGVPQCMHVPPVQHPSASLRVRPRERITCRLGHPEGMFDKSLTD